MAWGTASWGDNGWGFASETATLTGNTTLASAQGTLTVGVGATITATGQAIDSSLESVSIRQRWNAIDDGQTPGWTEIP